MLHRGLVPIPSGWIPARRLPCKNQASDRSEIPALCGINVPRDTTSLKLDDMADSLPKVAPQAAQPWALRRDPVGIRDKPISTGNFWAFKTNVSQRDCVTKPGVGPRHEGLPQDGNPKEYPTPTELRPDGRWECEIRPCSVPNHFPVRRLYSKISFLCNLPRIIVGTQWT
jgi:hypothetical protein